MQSYFSLMITKIWNCEQVLDDLGLLYCKLCSTEINLDTTIVLRNVLSGGGLA